MASLLDEEANKTFFNHILDLWVRPEMERRAKDNKISQDFVLNSAQVIMYPDGRQTVIRLNDEVKAILIAVARRGIKVNERFPLEDGIKDIREIKLTDRDDPDAGHLTMLLFDGKWYMSFDFRYNKAKAKEFVESARDFLDNAKFSYEKEKWRPFIDNMFSATELLVVAQLLPHADSEYSKKQWHQGTEKRYASMVDIGNFKLEYKNTLLELRKLRKQARYHAAKFVFNKEDAVRYLNILEDMINYTKKTLN